MKLTLKILIVAVLVMLIALNYMNKFYHKEIYTIIGETADHDFLIGLPDEPNEYTFIFEKKYKIGDVIEVVYTGEDNIIRESVID